jgi:hypothetical protein
MKKGMALLSFVALVGVSATSFAQTDLYVVVAGKRAVRTVLVSPKSTAAESGTALLNALAGITDASASNPYLLVIEPGIYDVGTSSVRMKEYVDIQGSGQTVTTIQGTTNSESAGVLMGASHCELRNLTVKRTGWASHGYAIDNNATSPTMTQVTAIASGAGRNYGVYSYYSWSTMTGVTATASGGQTTYGVYNNFSWPTMTQVTATASGATGQNTGVYNKLSAPTMIQVTATASGEDEEAGYYGVSNRDSMSTMTQATITASGPRGKGVVDFSDNPIWQTRIDHSVISGDFASVISFGGSCFIANTRLEGPLGDDHITCAGVYDRSYTFYANTCPE